MEEMRKRIRPLFYMRSPAWMLRIGAAVIGTETELVLKSRWVIPKKLLEQGFTFTYPSIDKALDTLVVSG